MAARVASVRALVLHGRLADVSLGTPLETVLRVLGPSTNTHEDASLILLSYGPYEVHLWKQTDGNAAVFRIQNDSLQYDNGLMFASPVLQLEPWCLSSMLHIKAMTSILQGDGVSFDVVQRHARPVIQVHGGAAVGFRANGLLDSIVVRTEDGV